MSLNLYMNRIIVNISLYEVALILEHQKPNGEGQMEVATKMEVVISPQLAQQLANILNDRLSKYQMKYGAIPAIKDEGE